MPASDFNSNDTFGAGLLVFVGVVFVCRFAVVVSVSRCGGITVSCCGVVGVGAGCGVLRSCCCIGAGVVSSRVWLGMDIMGLLRWFECIVAVVSGSPWVCCVGVVNSVGMVVML